MNRKFIIICIILLIASCAFVSAANNDTSKADSDYEIILIEKQWVNDNDNLRPDSVHFKILRNGNTVGEFTLLKSNNWQLTDRITLPIHDDNGNSIEYTFEESGASDYNLRVVKNGDLNYTLVNTYVNHTSPSNNTNTTNDTIIDVESDSGSGEATAHSPSKTTTTKTVKTNTTNKTLENKKAGNPFWLIPLCFIIIITVVVNRKR